MYGLQNLHSTFLQPQSKLKTNIFIQWVWLIIPFYIITLVLLDQLKFTCESALLLIIFNTLFGTSVPLIIAYLAGMNYNDTGSKPVLITGCGSLFFGTVNLLSVSMINQVDIALSLYDIGTFLTGFCFLLNAIGTLTHKFENLSVKKTECILGLSYLGTIVVGALILFGATKVVIPKYYIEGQDFTLLRQIFIYFTATEYIAASLIMLLLYRKSGTTIFWYWHGLGLALLGLGIATVIPAGTSGTFLSWWGRFGQYLGNLFILFALQSLLKTSELKMPLPTNRSIQIEPEEQAAACLAEQRALEFDALISSTVVGVIIYDNLGNIIKINDYAKNLLEYNVEDYSKPLVEHRSDLFLCKSDGKPYQIEETPLYRALQGRAIHNEEMILNLKPNRKIWLSGTLVPINNHQTASRVIFAFIDITTQKQEAYQQVVNILESISDCFYALDHEWRFTYINKGTEKFSGKTRDELLGKNIWEDYSQTMNDPLNYYFHKAMLEQIPVVFEVRMPEIGNWYEYHAFPGKDGLSVYFRDITQQKQSQKTIQHLAAIVETSEDAIFTITSDGIISSWNYGAEKLYGYTAAEAIGNSWLFIVPTGFHDQMRLLCDSLNKGLLFEDDRTTRIRKDGSPVYVSIKSSLIKDEAENIVEISSIHRDISERIKSEEELTKERELLMITLNSLTEGVVAADSENRIFLINEAAVKLTGYSQMEAIDEPLEKILVIIDNEANKTLSASVLQNSSQILHQPILITRNLNELLISIHCAPIKSIDARIIGTVIVFEDITEKHRTEQELFKAEKLESLGILAGGIAHDFNNFLTAILSNIQLAQIKYRLHESIDKYLQQSVDSTYQASRLTRQLLTFSKGGAPVKQAASLVELIQDTARFVLRGSNVKVECNISKDLNPAEVDPGQISQVIHNLVLNAKQAMPNGGMIEINAENEVIPTDRPRIKAGNYIKIVVKDQGKGILKENLTKIFDPFFTTKKDGSGLGLAISYSIIRQHDGYIDVESEVGVGTTFNIYLPAVSEAALIPETPKEFTATAQKLKILLMDDEESILESISEMLEYYGHEVAIARDGAKVVEIYQQALKSQTPFDVVIMDLTVPGGMGGQEAIGYLKEIDPKVKAIVSSGYANDPIISDYKRFGFCGVVTKPYKFNELDEVLSQVYKMN